MIMIALGKRFGGRTIFMCRSGRPILSMPGVWTFRYLLLLLFFIISPFLPTYAQESSLSGETINYYLQLRNEEFQQTMLPKERYLLGLVKNVTEELWRRQSEGFDLTELDIEEIVSPEELIIEEYAEEFTRIASLLDEIESLEKTAKQHVNLQALETLSTLKERITGILEQSVYLEHEADSDSAGSSQDSLLQSISDQMGEDLTAEPLETYSDPIGLEALFQQWKYNRLIEYKRKYAEYELLRTRLLKSATPDQEKRMFQKDLKQALETYQRGEFTLARIQLQDVLDTYTRYKFLDDVLYYCSETAYGLNYLDNAIVGYNRLITEYPNSPFCAKALTKLIFIYYIYGEFGKLNKTFQSLMKYKEHLTQESLGTVSYLVGYAHFKSGQFDKALESLGNVVPSTPYFFPALYLSAACYSNMGEDNLAHEIYERLIDEGNQNNHDEIFDQIRNNALLKLGLIYYERGENGKATEYFNQVTQEFKHYDLSVMGKAWSAYKAGRPAEALRSVEWLLRNSMISNYTYEARVLAASSKELLGHSEEAIDDLKKVFQIGTQSERSGLYAPEREGVMQDIQIVENLQQQMIDARSMDKIAEVEQIQRFLQNSFFNTTGSESDSVLSDNDISKTAEIIMEKIAALDLLETQAQHSSDQETINEIRSLRSELFQTLEDHSDRVLSGESSLEEDPLIRRMGLSEYLKYLFSTLLVKTVREKEQTKKNIVEATAIIDEARKQGAFEVSLRTEITKEELEDYYNRLNQYEVWLRENFPQEFRVELDQWATFSGYGISNINFSRIKDCDNRISQISQTISTLDDIFEAKRKRLEYRIQGLLGDVAKIEEQMRQEAALRENKEKDRFFKAEYFERLRQEPVTGKLREKPESTKKEENK